MLRHERDDAADLIPIAKPLIGDAGTPGRRPGAAERHARPGARGRRLREPSSPSTFGWDGPASR